MRDWNLLSAWSKGRSSHAAQLNEPPPTVKASPTQKDFWPATAYLTTYDNRTTTTPSSKSLLFRERELRYPARALSSACTIQCLHYPVLSSACTIQCLRYAGFPLHKLYILSI